MAGAQYSRERKHFLLKVFKKNVGELKKRKKEKKKRKTPKKREKRTTQTQNIHKCSLAK